MATLTKQQLALLKLQLQNDPEFKTGLYESEPVYNDFSFEQLFNAPKGPLYNVTKSPDSDSIPYGDSDVYFDESLDNYENNYKVPQPKGPLHSVNIERTMAILDALDVEDPSGELAAKYIERFGGTDGEESMYETVDTNSFPLKGAEFRAKGPDELDLTKKMQITTKPDNRTYGYTRGPTLDDDNLPQTGSINLNPDLAQFLTTRPTSPRNERPIDSGLFTLGMQKPVDLMNLATSVVQHEYGHNVLDLPGFENVRKSGIEAAMPSTFQLKGAPGSDSKPRMRADGRLASNEFDREELFNRAIDIQRYYNKHGNFGIPGKQNIAYMNQLLEEKYKNSNSNGQSLGIQYLNSVKPQVDEYFNEIDRQNNMSYINKQKLRRGMPENLGDAGQSLNNMSKNFNQNNIQGDIQSNSAIDFNKSGIGVEEVSGIAELQPNKYEGVTSDMGYVGSNASFPKKGLMGQINNFIGSGGLLGMAARGIGSMIPQRPSSEPYMLDTYGGYGDMGRQDKFGYNIVSGADNYLDPGSNSFRSHQLQAIRGLNPNIANQFYMDNYGKTYDQVYKDSQNKIDPFNQTIDVGSGADYYGGGNNQADGSGGYTGGFDSSTNNYSDPYSDDTE